MNGLIGRQIDHYRIDALLGEGGMGSVYRAQDLNLARPVALKVMHAQLASQPEFKARFMQEAQSAARLSHPSVVTVHYFGASHNLLYMVMAYIAGGSLSAHLRQILQKGEAVQLGEILIFLSQVGDALGYAHRQGVVHRDIKPSNVLVQRLATPDRDTGMPLRAVVTDFGLAKLLTGGFETKSDVLIGTYPYMSPEQCLHLTVDGRSDIYSLGVMLYQLTTGKLPLDIKSATDAVLKHHSGAMPLPPRDAWPGLPVVVEEIINKAIAKKPEERYQTGEEIASALREAAKTLVDEDVTQFVGQRNVKSLSTVAEPEISRAEPSRMGFDLQPGPGGDRLIIAQKEHTPRSMPLNKPSLTIGRSDDNDIVLDHNDISRRHARLDQTATGWRVTDLGSTNGTHLGGNKLLKDSPEDLPPGETMRLGPYFIHWQRVEARSAVGSLMGSGVRLPSGATHFQSKSGQVGVVVKPAKVEIMPGTRAAVQVELFNEATLVDHLKLSISGLPPTWVTLRDPVTELMPGGTATMTFEVHPPQDASARAGTHPYNLIVTSEAKPGESMTVPGEIVVQPFERFTVEFHPSQLPDGGKTQVTIRNQGNAEGTYSLTGRDPAGAVQFAGEHGRIRAASGQAAVQEVTIKAKNRPLIGMAQMLPFELLVKSAGNAQQALPGQLKVIPLIPRWVPLLLGVLFMLCVFGGQLAYGAIVVKPSQTASAGTATSDALIALASQQNAAQGTAAALTAEAEGDADEDGLSNQKEVQLDTDPRNPDTDRDGLSDGEEVNVYGTEPKNNDTDADGLLDGDEVNGAIKTLPRNPDSDGDGVNDGAEIRNGTDPLATPTLTPQPTPTSPATPTPPPPVPPTTAPPPTPTDPVTGFPGTWINVHENPVAFSVSEPLTRLVIAKVDRDTATFNSCKCRTDACNSQVELDPPKVVANLAGDELRADTNFNVADNHTWSIKAIKAGSNLLVTVQEKRPDGATPSETFEMKLKPVNPVANPLFDSCEPPIFILPIRPIFILPTSTVTAFP